MKRYALTGLLLLAGLTHCRRPVGTDEPLPLTHPELRITSIRFAGIPDDNVLIDQPTRTIRVRMPATLPGTATPSVTLSDEAKLTGDLASAGIGAAGRWCTTDTASYQKIYLTSKQATAQSPVVPYTIRPEATNPLTAADASAPMRPFAIGDSTQIRLPVQHLYGNALPRTVTFTNRTTNAQVVVTNQTLGSLLCSSTLPSHIDVSAYGLALEPGQYTVVMQRADGTTLTEPNPLDLKAGKASLDRDPVFGYTLVAGQPASLTVSGTNLFSEQVSVRLVSPDGSTTPIAQTQRRSPFVLTVPANLKPGYYGIDLVQNGQSTGTVYRLSVLQTANQPFIGMVNYQPVGKTPVQTPLPLPRDQAIVVAIGNRAATSVLTLTSLSNPAQTYRLPVVLALEAYPKFTITSGLPAGRYTAQIQQIDPATQQVIQSSEPFERPIDVP